jgi:hypothetical protein
MISGVWGYVTNKHFGRNTGNGFLPKYAILRKIALLAGITPNSGQKWLYRKSDYPEYFRESQQQRHFLAKYSG